MMIQFLYILLIDLMQNMLKKDTGKNLINIDGEIFKIPVRFYWEKDLIRKHKILKANFKKVNIDILNKKYF